MGRGADLAEGEGFEPPVRLPVRLISSQVPLTTQPPFQIQYVPNGSYYARIKVGGKVRDVSGLRPGQGGTILP